MEEVIAIRGHVFNLPDFFCCALSGCVGILARDALNRTRLALRVILYYLARSARIGGPVAFIQHASPLMAGGAVALMLGSRKNQEGP